jgi:hypothetical protein
MLTTAFWPLAVLFAEYLFKKSDNSISIAAAIIFCAACLTISSSSFFITVSTSLNRDSTFSFHKTTFLFYVFMENLS